MDSRKLTPLIRFHHSPEPVLVPEKNCDWADTAVINPAIFNDADAKCLHMIFRASGAYSNTKKNNQSPPFPIFLGYARSDNNGQIWVPDFSAPALSPALKDNTDEIYITGNNGNICPDYTNGCIEDPRIFLLEGEWYLTAACRMFPPGPFWVNDEPMQCAPGWAKENNHPFGRAASENVTVSVLYKVNIENLRNKKYKKSFEYITHLTNPERGDNRDVIIFPEKLEINDRKQYVMLHRPKESFHYQGGADIMKPSIWMATADEFEDFPTKKARHYLLAEPIFDWENDRIGVSAPLVKISADEWLLPYHGKKDDVTGYTQSFIILKNSSKKLPEIIHRCPVRLMYPQYEWEKDGLLKAPCIFTSSAVRAGDELLMGYGAGDRKTGIARADWNELIDFIRRYDPSGRKIK